MKRCFLLCLLLGGCVSIPEKELGNRIPPPTLESLTETALNTEDFHVGDWPNANWWEMFGDENLNGLISQALEENPTLKKSEARVHAAKQAALQKRAALFPEFDARYEESWEHLSQNGLFRSAAPTFPAVINLIDLALDFHYEFDFFGKNRDYLKAALGQERAEIAEYAASKLILTTAVCTAYFNLQGAQEKLKIMKEILHERTSLMHLVRSRFEHGLDTDIEKLGAMQTIYETERAVLALETVVAVTQHLLAALIGKEPDFLKAIQPEARNVISFPLPENISLDLLARRPDLMAQIWRVEAAAHEINAAKTNFYPNITLDGTGGLESLAFNMLFKRTSLMGGLSPAVHLPIFTAGRLRAELDKKVAYFDEAVYAYNDLLLKAAQNVADELVSLSKINDQARVQKMSLESIRQTFTLKLFRYTAGVTNYLTVLTAQEDLLQQRFIAADLNEQQLLYTVKLIKSLGGGYD
jgi:NodT family efflux transporter outer membrane factor (OMF) lipoprotein